jgi:hypothetical protein
MIIIIGEFFLNTNYHELNMKAEGLASDSEKV